MQLLSATAYEKSVDLGKQIVAAVSDCFSPLNAGLRIPEGWVPVRLQLPV